MGAPLVFFPQPTTLPVHVLLLKHPVFEQVWETFEPFVDPSIRLIPFLTGAQTVGGGISPDQAQFRFMRMVEYINVRHDSKEHNEPIFALQMQALHVGERRDQTV